MVLPAQNPLAYLGINNREQPRTDYFKRAPQSNDILNAGFIWVDESVDPNVLYLSRGEGNWQQIAPITSSGGLVWNDNATTTTIASNNGYIVQAGQPTFTMPATCTVGDIVEVVSSAGTGWILQAQAGQTLGVYNNSTSAGGTLTASNVGSAIRLVCTVDPTRWVATSISGNPAVA